MMKVGITGGIGSGKTTICRLFAALGIPVYYTDNEAKRIMHEDMSVRRAVSDGFGDDIYGADGLLDRRCLAAKVFGDPDALAHLNSIVHPAVVDDFERWCGMWPDASYVIMESAILFSAGIDDAVDVTLAVLAPETLRIERACCRDGAMADDIKRRIRSQMSDDELADRADYTIVNISIDDVEKDVAELDRIFRRKASLGRS